MRTAEVTYTIHPHEPYFHVKALGRGTNFCSIAEVLVSAALWKRAGQ